jgi:hypothetical protein
MKAVKLTFLCLGLLINVCLNPSILLAQKSHCSVSLSPLLPLSPVKDYAGWGFMSGNVNYSFDLTKRLSWCFSVAYNRFGSQKVIVDALTSAEYESNLAYFPVTSGIKYFINDVRTRYYLAAGGGYYFPSVDLEKGDWGFSPGIGMQIPIQSKIMKIDISFNYNRVFGSTTKEFKAYSKYGGYVTSQTSFRFTSYLALNIGIVFGK